ncbi:MAG: 50S ribosomal protein L10 [Patescibacteria group bacterium]
MPKTKQQKIKVVETLDEGFKKAKSVVFANFQGLTVAQAQTLRGECQKENIQVLAAKKTLVKRVCQNMGYDVDPKVFQGGIATFFGMGDEVAPARIVNNFAKKNEIVTIFGGVLEGKFITADYVKNLATLPSKQELLGKLVGTINAPVSGFVNVLAGNLRGLVSVLNNISARGGSAQG